MQQAPQSTSLTVMLKLFLSSDHISAATGKTLAITISKNGGAFGNPNAGATNATEVANGWYKVTLDTTDTGTLGDLVVRGTATACDDTERLYTVVKATNGGLTAIPDTAVTTNASLITSGTGTDQLSVTSGRIDIGKLLGTAWLTPAVAGTPDVNAKQIGGQAASLNANNLLKVSLNDILATALTETSGQLAGGFKKFFNVAAPASTMDALTLVATASALTTNNDKTGYSLSVTPPTAAAIATAVWTDTTAGDFTTASSIGKSIMNGVALGTGLTINDLTTKTGFSLTQTFPTNFSSLSIDSSGRVDLAKWIGVAPLALSSQQVQAIVPNTQKVDVDTIKTNPVVNGGTITFPTGATLASTTGAVGSVTGNVGGNVTGSVGSISGVTFPTNFASLSISTLGMVDCGNVIRRGTAQTGSNSTTTIHLDSGASATDGFYVGRRITFLSGTGAGCSAICTAYSASAKAATFRPPVAVAPDNTTVFQIEDAMSDVETFQTVYNTSGVIPAQLANLAHGGAAASINLSGGVTAGSMNLLGTITATDGDNHIHGIQVADLTAAALQQYFSVDSFSTYGAAVAGSVVKEIADNAGGGGLTAADVWSYAARVLTAGDNIVLPSNGLSSITAWTVNVTGDLSGSVGSIGVGGIASSSFSAGAIDAAAIATDALGSLELAAGAASEIATAVASQITTDHGSGSYIRNTEPLDAAGVRTAIGLASANLDTQLDALPTNSELATALASADDATLAAIAALGSPMQAGAHVQLATTQDQYAPAKEGDSMALTSGERASVAAAILDLVDGIESGETLRECLRLIRAATLGKTNGFPDGPFHFRDKADAKNRITGTSDASGNRLTITTDAS